jgi:thioredoxin-like negative regulator of GroEL
MNDINRVNQCLNAVVLVVTLAAGGYVAYASSGFGLLAEIAPPDDAWFRSAVLERSQPVVVKFGAEWCGPCRMLDRELDRLSENGVAVVRIDVGRHRELARHYHVSAIPHVYLFHRGALIAHRVGYADFGELRKWIDRNLSH